MINRFFLTLVLIITACTGCLISSGTHGKIENYEFECSKRDVHNAIKTLYESKSKYALPIQYAHYRWHYGGDSSTNDKWIKEANADSVSFNFYFKDLNCIMWSSFVGFADNWEEKTCELSLIGYVDLNDGKWKFKNDLKKEKINEIKLVFRDSIVTQINRILTEKGK